MKKSLIITIIAALIFGGGGFFGGIYYQKTKSPVFAPTGMRQQVRQNNMGRAVRGEILSATDINLTVKMPDGSTKIVILSGATTVSEATTAGKEALQTGKTVVVFGNDNSDGSITAQNIQLGTVR